jgi:hypothetical protein
MRTARRRLSAVALAGACLAGGGLSQAAPAVAHPVQRLRLPGATQRPGRQGWRLVARVAVPGKLVAMLSVTAAGAGDAWASGFAAGRGGRASRLIIEHWLGRSWRPVAVPEKALAAFDRGSLAFAIIGASSESNVWAFNQLTGAWLRWNGHRWSEGLVSRLTGRSAIGIISTLVLGPDRVWAFGARVNGHGDAFPFAARFDGRRWKVTPMPHLLNLMVSAASAVSPRDIWAVIGRGGQSVFPPGPYGGALAHWDGRRWQLMPLPARLARRGDPTSIAAISDRDIWVGGGTQNSKLGLNETAAHWDGKKWQAATLPAAASPARCVLSSIVPGARAGIAALGLCFIDQSPGVRSRLWQLAAGRWSGPAKLRLTSGWSVIAEFAPAGHTGSVWAAGFSARDGLIALNRPAPNKAGRAGRAPRRGSRG